MAITVDVALLKSETVRCALALTAFGVIGCLAWLEGGRDGMTIDPDRGVAVAAVVGHPAPASHGAPRRRPDQRQ